MPYATGVFGFVFFNLVGSFTRLKNALKKKKFLEYIVDAYQYINTLEDVSFELVIPGVPIAAAAAVGRKLEEWMIVAWTWT